MSDYDELLTSGERLLERIERREAAAASRAAAEGQFLKGRNVHDLRSEREIVVDDTVENLQALSDRLSRLEARHAPPDAEDAEFEALRAKSRAGTLEGAEAVRFAELAEALIPGGTPVTFSSLGGFTRGITRVFKKELGKRDKKIEALEARITAMTSNRRRGVS
jgi:hypothetical protein